MCALFVLFCLSLELNPDSAALHGEQGSGYDISPVQSLLPGIESRVAESDYNSDLLPGIVSQAAEFTCLASFSRHSDLVCHRLVFPIKFSARVSLSTCAAAAALPCRLCLPGLLLLAWLSGGWLAVWSASWLLLRLACTQPA
jgi:hypothetical protein